MSLSSGDNQRVPGGAKPESTESCSRTDDFPAALLARVVKSDATIFYDGMTPEGDLKFWVPLRAIQLSRAAFARNALMRSTYSVNLVGEVLVRKNIALFADILHKIDPRDYDRIVNGFQHRNFGLTMDKDDHARFQFHVSLVQKILTEDLEAVL